MNVARRDTKSETPFATVDRNHLEVALACKALARFGWDEQDIATEVHVPEHEVSTYLMLAGAPFGVRSQIQSGMLCSATVLRALHDKGPAELERYRSGVRVAEDAKHTVATSDGSKKQQQTNTWRLLQALETNGEKDADQLEQMTGIRKPVIVSTLYTAMGRGQVKCTPKGIWLREAGLLAATGKAPRGQVYGFVSYESRVGVRSADSERSEVQSRLDEMAELLFKPNLMKMVSMLDSVCKARKVTLVGLH